MSTCASCGTHTGTHWPDCPHSSQYDPNYGKPDTPATRLEDAKTALDKADKAWTEAKTAYDKALQEFKQAVGL